MTKLLSRTEEMILLAVGSLGDEAYGITIRKKLESAVGKRYSVGAVYVPLERLENRGLLSSNQSDPTPERGGRSKRYFQLTQKGLAALEESKRLYESMWAGMPELRSVRSAGA